ncbi:MAG: hypothetical protein WAK93_06690 [Solirubrobacteraceae bacterium]
MGDHSVLDARHSQGSTAWTPPERLGSVTGQTQAVVAAAGSGAAVVAWTPNEPGTSQTVEMRYRSSYDTNWGPAATADVGPGHTVSSIRVAIDARGRAYVAWRGPAGIMLASRSPSAQGWAAARLAIPDRRPPSSQPGRALSLAVSSSGVLALLWEDHLSGGMQTPARDLLHVRVRSERGTWSPATRIGVETTPAMQGDAQAESPVLSAAFGSSSKLFTTWQAASRAGTAPRVAVLGAGRGWRTARQVTIRAEGLYPVIAASARDFAVVLWIATNGAVETADLTPAGHLTASRTLGNGQFPNIVSNEGGDFAAAWGNQAAYRTRKWCKTRSFGQVAESSVAIAPNGAAEMLLQRSNSIFSERVPACASGGHS